MTVISVWWRSNMPFQRLIGRLNYYITRCRQEVRELGTRCGRESHHPAEGALGTLSEFGDPLRTRCGRESQHSAESWAPGLLVEYQKNEKDTTLMAIRVGVNILQSLFGLQLPLTRNLSNKVRGIFFLKKSSLVFIHCAIMILHESVYEYTT